MIDEKLRKQYLQAMDIPIWVEKARGDNAESIGLDKSAEAAKPTADLHNPVAELSWEELEQAVQQCHACDLYKTRTRTVFGSGNRQADLLLIGEAPGAQEDLKGEPFVGRAGQLLNAMLFAIHLSREDIYIANILKSRPPNNRDPKPDEVRACTPFLERQITLIQPKLIVALGRISAHFLLKTNTPLNQLRGKTWKLPFYDIPLIVTYHPAYLLRSPLDKAKALLDWQKIHQILL